jgi:PBSX family phage terminase large subunit
VNTTAPTPTTAEATAPIVEAARRYLANPAQAAFLADPAKYRAAVAGVGAGKTEVGAFDLIRHLLRYPGMEALLVAPTYRMLYRSCYQVVRRVLRWWDSEADPIIAQENRSEGWLRLRNGSRLWLGYAQDPDSLRAVEVAVAMMDEAAYCPERAFEVLQGRCRQPGYPHRVWITTTPHGRNWVYERFVARAAEGYSYHHWTTYDNPALTAEDLAAWEASYGSGTDWHAQEMLAQFVQFRGLVYAVFDEERFVVSASSIPPSRFAHIVAGVDWGVSAPGCIAVVGIAPDGKVWWLDEVYERGLVTHGDPGNDWASIARDLQKQWGVEVFFADPEDANAIKAWQHMGIPVRRANNAVLEGIREVQSVMAANRLRVWRERCPYTLTEIKQYHWREDADGNPLEDTAPVKEFDHALDARRYAHMGLRALGLYPEAETGDEHALGLVTRRR